MPGNTFNIAVPVAKQNPPPNPGVKGKVVLQQEGVLNGPNSKTKLQVQKSFMVELTAGKTYMIQLNKKAGSDIDPYLKLLDPTGKQVAQDDDGGGDLNARIVYTPMIRNISHFRHRAIRPDIGGGFQLVVTEKE